MQGHPLRRHQAVVVWEVVSKRCMLRRRQAGTTWILGSECINGWHPPTPPTCVADAAREGRPRVHAVGEPQARRVAVILLLRGPAVNGGVLQRMDKERVGVGEGGCQREDW